MQHGFLRVAAAIPAVRVADTDFNAREISRLMQLAQHKGVELLVMPELCLTGYTCADLFAQQLLLDRAEQALIALARGTAGSTMVTVVGLPLRVGPLLLNCAAVLQDGRVRGVVPKTFLPNYKEFYEQRWFASSLALPPGSAIELDGQQVPVGSGLIFRNNAFSFAIELCEDLWAPVPPSSTHALQGADIICNLSATDELIGKHDYLRQLLASQSARSIAGYVYASCGYGESTQDVVYAGNALVLENGHLLAASRRFAYAPQLVVSEIDVERLRTERRVNTSFAEAVRTLPSPTPTSIRMEEPGVGAEGFEREVPPHPFIPGATLLKGRCQEIFAIQAMGLAKRVQHTQAKALVVGVSGGLDSTLALLVCAHTCDKLNLPRTHIVGITMPGFGTTDRTYRNAVNLIHRLGATFREISIAEAATSHLRDIGHDMALHDVTYENGQARERTQVLFDMANQLGGFVVGTGDLSELALGWATYNGDHMSNYAVNVSVPKTLVRYLVEYVASSSPDDIKSILLDICATPVSPELLPADAQGNIQQKTEDLVGPYELHDFFLYYFLRHGFSPRKVFFLARHAFAEGAATDSAEHSVLHVTHYDAATIKKWLTVFCRRFFAQQFKRSCLPDGPKVGSICLSPRGDWRMPSDASAEAWLEACDAL